jgi:hypothetical protein
LGGNLTIKVELYNVGSGNLIASFTGDSKNAQGLLAVLEAKAPVLFGKMPRGSTEKQYNKNPNDIYLDKNGDEVINPKTGDFYTIAEFERLELAELETLEKRSQTVAAYAWNPPIGVCPSEAIKKLDTLFDYKEKGKLMEYLKKTKTKNNILPFDKGKCFLYGYDIYIDGDDFGLVNSKTGDRFSSGANNGYYGSKCSKDMNCLIVLDNNINELIFSINTDDYASFESASINFVKYDENTSFKFFKSSKNDDGGYHVILYENKAKNRFEGTFDFGGYKGYLKYNDMLSSLRKVNDYYSAYNFTPIYDNMKNSFVKDGEDCWEYPGTNTRDEKVSVKKCLTYKDGQCADKKRIWHNGELVTVSQVKLKDKDCNNMHGWTKNKTYGNDWNWSCFINNHEAEPSDCKGFSKW